MRPRPSVPIVTELYWPTLPVRSRVVRVAAVQAKLEQWATLRLPLVSSEELMRPRPSVPMVIELYWPTLSSLWGVVGVAAVGEDKVGRGAHRSAAGGAGEEVRAR